MAKVEFDLENKIIRISGSVPLNEIMSSAIRFFGTDDVNNVMLEIMIDDKGSTDRSLMNEKNRDDFEKKIERYTIYPFMTWPPWYPYIYV